MMRMTDEEVEIAVINKIDEIKYNEKAREKFLREVGKAICKSEKNKQSVLDAIDILTYIAKESGWVSIADNAVKEEKV